MIYLLIFIVYAIGLSAALYRQGYRAKTGIPTGDTVVRERISRILIVGATGGTGRHLVEQALDRGYAVTAFARSPAKFKLTHPNLTVVQGDVLDAGSVESAIEGHGAVLSALGHKRFLYPTRILSEGTRNIVRAMESRGVGRFVCQTSLGIGDSAGRMGLLYTFFTIPVILQFYFWDKTRQESIVAKSGLDWVIVRPGALTNGEKRGRLQHGRNIGSFFRTVRISRADTASFMLDQLESNSYVGTSVGVAW